MTQAHSDAGNAQTLTISNQSGLDDLKSIVSTVETVNTNQAELLKPIGPVLIVFENTGKWGTAADSWAGYNGQLKLINLTDTYGSCDFSIQFASENPKCPAYGAQVANLTQLKTTRIKHFIDLNSINGCC